jgi:hypothetical protein
MMSPADTALTAAVAVVLVAVVFVAALLVAAATATATRVLLEPRRTEPHDLMSGIRTFSSGRRTYEVNVENHRGRARKVRGVRSDAVATPGACMERQPVARARSPCGPLESRTGVTMPVERSSPPLHHK